MQLLKKTEHYHARKDHNILIYPKTGSIRLSRRVVDMLGVSHLDKAHVMFYFDYDNKTLGIEVKKSPNAFTFRKYARALSFTMNNKSITTEITENMKANKGLIIFTFVEKAGRLLRFKEQLQK